jgi:hypothetical protein
LATDRSLGVRALHFTPIPDVPALHPGQRRHLAGYAHTIANTHPVQPYAYLEYLYQQPVYFTGLMFALVMLAGLAGVVRNRRRRGGLPLLPWAVAAVGIVFPVAVHEYHYRYAISVVPVACLAAGLAFARRPAATVAGTQAGATPATAAVTAAADAAPAAGAAVPALPDAVPAPAPAGGTPAALASLPRPREPLTWQDEEL